MYVRIPYTVIYIIHTWDKANKRENTYIMNMNIYIYTYYQIYLIANTHTYAFTTTTIIYILTYMNILNTLTTNKLITDTFQVSND